MQKVAEWPFTTNLNFVCNKYKAVFLQNRVTIDILLLVMGSAS